MKHLILILLFFPTVCRAQSITISATKDTACVGSTVKFTAVAQGVSSRHYQWQVNGAAVGADSAGYITDSLRNNDTVSCLLTTLSHSVVATSNYKVMTMETFPLGGKITGVDSEVCVGATITLSASVGGGQWKAGSYHISVNIGVVKGLDAGDGFECSQPPGFDTVFYIVANNCASDSAKKEIKINPVPHAYFTLGMDSWGWSDNYLCVGQYIPIASAPNDFCGGTLSSSNNNATVTNSSWPGVTGAHEGTSTIYNTVTNICGTATYKQDITVSAGPQTSPAIKGSFSGICVGNTDSVSTFAGAGALTWYNEDGKIQVAQAGASALLTGMEAGWATILLRTANHCGYVDTAISVRVDATPASLLVPIVVLEKGSVLVNDSVTGGTWASADNAIATVDQTGLLTGIKTGIVTISHTTDAGCFSVNKVRVESTKEAITLFPNPATNELVLQQDELFYSNYHIINSVGEQAMSGTLGKGYNLIKVELLARGLYFVLVTVGKNKSVFKLAIE